MDTKTLIPIIITLLALANSVAAFSQNANMKVHKIHSSIQTVDSSVVWQKTNADVIYVFDPYIGKFRSESKYNKQLKKTIYFVVQYSWFNKQKTVVKTTLSYVIESENEEILNAEGFYGYDPIDNKIYSSQIFISGIRGYGGIEKYDLKKKSRTTRAIILDTNGNIRHVRDEFNIINTNSWKNITYFKNTDGKWKKSFSDIYTRI